MRSARSASSWLIHKGYSSSTMRSFGLAKIILTTSGTRIRITATSPRAPETRPPGMTKSRAMRLPQARESVARECRGGAPCPGQSSSLQRQVFRKDAERPHADIGGSVIRSCAALPARNVPARVHDAGPVRDAASRRRGPCRTSWPSISRTWTGARQEFRVEARNRIRH